MIISFTHHVKTLLQEWIFSKAQKMTAFGTFLRTIISASAETEKGRNSLNLELAELSPHLFLNNLKIIANTRVIGSRILGAYPRVIQKLCRHIFNLTGNIYFFDLVDKTRKNSVI